MKKISGYDVIILGDGIYASGIAGLSFLKKNIGKLKNKKTIVFCCGASPYEQKAYEAIMQYNFKGELTGIPCFYCRGTFDMSEMSFRIGHYVKCFVRLLPRRTLMSMRYGKRH